MPKPIFGPVHFFPLWLGVLLREGKEKLFIIFIMFLYNRQNDFANQTKINWKKRETEKKA